MLATSIYSNDTIVNILLNHGADISSYNELIKTAFMYAAAYCKIHTVKKIIRGELIYMQGIMQGIRPCIMLPEIIMSK